MIWTNLATWARVVGAPVHLRRTPLIAFAVGTWLNLFNRGDALLAGAWSVRLAAKLALTTSPPSWSPISACWRDSESEHGSA